MSGQEYQPGEILNVELRGVRVNHMTSQDRVVIRLGDDLILIDPALPETTITRVAPPEWPPRQGDVWVDRDGLACLALDADRLQYVNREHPFSAGYVLETFSPLTLVHREPDGGESGE